jgi:hypothetical protein
MAAGNASEAGDSAQGVGPFVINLCSSTTPMALSQPDNPDMKRFSFFVSRRREDNRERFRLHMGYFSSLAEAEEWLNVVRDIYPGAWAGEAPGKKLRARAAAAALATQLPQPPTAAAPRVVSVSAKPTAPVQAAAPVVARQALPSPTDLIVPTLHAAPGALAPKAVSATGMHRALPDLAGTGNRALGNTSSTPESASGTGTHRALPNASATGMHRALPDPSATGTHRAATNVVSATGMHRALENPSMTGTHRALPNASATGTHRALPNASGTGTNRALVNPSVTGTHKALTPPAPVQTRPVATPVKPAPAVPTRGAQQAKQPAAAQPPRQPAKAVPKKQQPGVPPALSGSNVREVMAALDETGETRQMRAPNFNPASKTSAPSVARTSNSLASAAPGAPARAKAPVSRPQAPAAEVPSLSDTQVLRFLEQRRDDAAERVDESANAGISMLKPDDTQTRLALKDAVRENAPVSFAVQLQWSVSPIELGKVPPLAIFSAYTLYTVEGSREGRKWYGLRLGFFSDAISAKQVAYYVRSEFTSVAVVPVSPAEKTRAGAEETKAATGRFAKAQVLQPKVDEFKLFDDAKPAPGPEIAPAAVAAASEKAPAKAAAAAKAAPPKKNKPLGKVRAKEQRSAKTLEETLEILGASELEIDSGRELLNDTGVRHLQVQVQKNTPFAKLLDRLSEKVRRN